MKKLFLILVILVSMFAYAGYNVTKDWTFVDVGSSVTTLKAGVTGKTRLAMKTAVPSAKAASVPDDPDMIAKARAVIAEL